jgi:hypothetical protein
LIFTSDSEIGAIDANWPLFGSISAVLYVAQPDSDRSAVKMIYTLFLAAFRIIGPGS